MSKKVTAKIIKQRKIVHLWFLLPPTWRKELVSALKTFVASFFAALLTQHLASGTFTWNIDALFALVVLAFRSGLRAMEVYVLSYVMAWINKRKDSNMIK